MGCMDLQLSLYHSIELALLFYILLAHIILQLSFDHPIVFEHALDNTFKLLLKLDCVGRLDFQLIFFKLSSDDTF